MCAGRKVTIYQQAILKAKEEYHSYIKVEYEVLIYKEESLKAKEQDQVFSEKQKTRIADRLRLKTKN